MKALKIIALFLLVSILTAGGLIASGAGTTSNNFLKLAQGARPAGMGEAFVGIADDVNAVYWNPAGLSQLTRQQVCLMHSVWLIDVSFDYIAYALPISGIGTFGLYGVYLNAGEIYRTEEDALGQYVLTEDKAKATGYNITLAYAKKFSDFLGQDSFLADLSMGLDVNITSETIYTDTGGGFGVNIGAFFYPKYENLSIGLTAENIGVTTNRPSLPTTIKLGFGYRFALENALLPFTDEGYFTRLDNNAAGTLDIIYYPVEQIAKVHAGAEKYWDLNKFHSLAIRLGYKFGEDLGALAGLTAGLGYRLTVNKETNFELDYVVVPYDVLGVSHRISLTGKFGGKAEDHFYEDKKAGMISYKKGYELLYKKQFADALINFADCVKRYRAYSPAYIGVGSCFLNLGKKQLAMKAYIKALELDPKNIKLKEYIEAFKRTPQFPGAQ